MITKPQINLSIAQKEHACEIAANGADLKKICADLKISVRTLSNIFNRDPSFAKEIARAREMHVHSLVESLIGITKGCTTMAEVSAAKVESDNIKWAAGKFVPEIYGENINVNLNHQLDLSSVLLAAENRVIPILQAKRELTDSQIVDCTIVDVNEAIGVSNDTTGVPAELRDLI